MSKLTFEDKIDDIQNIINFSRGKWKLDFLSYIDFDDVRQILLIHVNDKWSLWDQERPFEPWVSTTISNRMKNIVRDNFSSSSPPCSTCILNMYDGKCKYTKSGKQDSSCPLYKNWEKKKKPAREIKSASFIDDCYPELSNKFSEKLINYEDKAKEIHILMIHRLHGIQKVMYKMMFVDYMTDEQISNKSFKKGDVKSKKFCVKHIRNYRKKFKEMASKIVNEEIDV